MDNAIQSAQLLIPAIPAIIIAINEFLKKMGMPEKLAPLVNVVLGFSLAIYPFLTLGFLPFYATISAIVVGLSAGGFYSGYKTYTKPVEVEKPSN